MSGALAFVDRLKRNVVGDRLVRRNPFYYERFRRLLSRLDRAPLEERREWTRDLLGRTLAAARRTEYGKSAGGGDEIGTWPLLQKELLRDRLAHFTTGTEWFSAPANTGGTAGVPLKLVRSLDGIVFEQACIDRLTEQLGLHARNVRMTTIRGDNLSDPRTLHSPDGVSAQGGRSRIFCAHAVSPQNIERIAASLEKFAPDLLCAYPSALEVLCRLLLERRHALSIPAVLTSSEVLKPEGWALAQRVLGARLCDYYGQSERVAFAYALAPRQYRFLPGYSYVEFLPHTGNLLPENSADRLYEIVGTTYWNRLMPLVRYRTGDLIRLPASWGAAQLEELSLGLRTFPGILGREQEVMVCPTGVRLTGLDSIPHDVEHVLRIQIVQETLDSARVRVLSTEEFNDADAARLLENVRAKLPCQIKLGLELAQSLERTPRGKTPLVVHRPPVHDALRRAGVEPMRTQ